MENKTYVWQDIFLALIISVLIDLKIISQSLVKYLNANDGFFTAAMLFCYVLFMVVAGYNLFSSKFVISEKKFKLLAAYYFVILVWYFFSRHVTNTSLLQLVSYACLPPLIYACNERNNIQQILFFVMFISAIVFPITNEVLVIDYRNSIGMDAAYAFLPGIVAGLVHFAFYRNKINKFLWILYGVQAYYLFNILMYSVRGPVVCIIATFLLMVYVGPRRKKLTFSKLVIGAALFVLAFSLDSIITWLADSGVEWYFVRKSAKLFEAGNMLHGRDNLSMVALQGFWNSPLYGNGLNSFLHFTGYIYPHNFITQFLFEGGVIITFFVFLLFAVSFSKLFRNKNAEDLITFIFLFPVCVIYYLMSANIWVSPLFWLFIGFLFQILTKNDNEFVNTNDGGEML